MMPITLYATASRSPVMRWGDAAGNFMSKAVRTGPSRDIRATFSKTRGIRSIAVMVATIMATIPNSAPKTISDVGPMPKKTISSG